MQPVVKTLGIIALMLGAALGTIGLLSVAPAGGQSPALRPGLPIEALAQTVWIEEFDVSPDGNLIAFKSAKGGTYDIWTVSAEGGEPKQLTRMPGREMAPRFSPDGRWIAFEADFGGTNIRHPFRRRRAGPADRSPAQRHKHFMVS